MEFRFITSSDALWQQAAQYAAACSWSAGTFLARDMAAGAFSDWERVIVATEADRICGYCTVAKTDCIPNVPYTPYIGYLFVDEEYRGHRLSQRLISFASSYLKEIGFHEVYLVSDHENLYEKWKKSTPSP